MYPEEIVIPMKEELTENGFSELLTADAVETKLAEKGTTLVMINSVCGCSAGTARPGVLMAVSNSAIKPDNITTSFAGFDIEAVNKLREHLMPYPPSSPSIALFTFRIEFMFFTSTLFPKVFTPLILTEIFASQRILPSSIFPSQTCRYLTSFLNSVK